MSLAAHVQPAPSVPTVRPKVLEVMEATAGGTGCYIADLLLHIDTVAFDVSFAYSTLRSDARFLKDLERIKRRGIRVYEVPMLHPIRPAEDIRALWGLYRLIKTQKFDIVHGHSSKAGFLARLAAKLADPRIVTVYSPHAISISANPKYRYLERFAGLLTNVLLGVSRSERDELEAYQLVPRSKLRYATTGINMAAYVGSFGGSDLRRRIGVPNGTILIGSAGRILAQKDPATFLKAAAAALERGVSAHFAWAGDGELRSASQKLARDLGIERQVTFLGYCPDLRPFLDALDIFALTSRYESFGYVTCEAMALGKPVVATNVSGSNELVQHGTTGYLVDVADAQGLAVAFRELASDWELRRRMGEAGRARARKYYDLRIMIRDVEQVYRESFRGEHEARDDRRTAGIPTLEVNRS
ncbi:MAG: glycosyltransferase family 4 protein [Candidatus Acidiferrales bacterium]|jgi:glycosyltransferase involved in cell wall biosynthesis